MTNQLGKLSRDNNNVGIQRINRFDIAIDSSGANQAVRAKQLTSFDQSREVGRASRRRQFVSLHFRHNLTLSL
jgi:hypothetical protein